MSRFRQADLDKVRTISLKNRKSKVEISSAAKVLTPAHADKFFKSLPKYLKASELNEFISRVVSSRKKGFPFHLLMGAHVIKVGLSPIIIDLMKNNIVTGLSFNSAGLIHDLELAFTGCTSEDVRANLQDGSFGMAADTGNLFAEVVKLADSKSIGLGEAAGVFINKQKARYRIRLVSKDAGQVTASISPPIAQPGCGKEPTKFWRRKSEAAEDCKRDSNSDAASPWFNRKIGRD